MFQSDLKLELTVLVAYPKDRDGPESDNSTMQLTRAADYGVRALVYLAGRPPESRVGVAELARAAEAPEAFLTKVLQRLVAAGFVASHRGPAGGFQLNTPAAAISLLNVVEAIEGPVQLNLCTGVCDRGPACAREDWCPVHRVWQHAQAKVREILDASTLEALAQESNRRLASLQSVSSASI